MKTRKVKGVRVRKKYLVDQLVEILLFNQSCGE